MYLVSHDAYQVCSQDLNQALEDIAPNFDADVIIVTLVKSMKNFKY